MVFLLDWILVFWIWMLGFSFGLDRFFLGFGFGFFFWIGLFVALTIQDYGGFLMHKSIFQHHFHNYVFVRKAVPLAYVIPVLILNDFDRFGPFCLPDPVGKSEVDLGWSEGRIGLRDEISPNYAIAHLSGMEYIQDI